MTFSLMSYTMTLSLINNRMRKKVLTCVKGSFRMIMFGFHGNLAKIIKGYGGKDYHG